MLQPTLKSSEKNGSKKGVKSIVDSDGRGQIWGHGQIWGQA